MDMKISADGRLRSPAGDKDAVPDQIARELEEDIVFGNLRPGQKLPEEDLSERFSASRHQVREALALLARVGMVVKERNKGVRVRIFTAEEVHQIYDIREMLQRQAALRIPLPASRAAIGALEAIHAEYEKAVADGDFRRIHETNDRFHSELFRLCGNDMLWQLVKDFMELSYVVRANSFNPEHLVIARREHRIMLDLLRTRDSWSLSQLCVDHIQYSREQYLAFLTLQDNDQTMRVRHSSHSEPR
jgi:DNA-binding GntR family transcriptional regulator